jgi:hypothetical protein
MQNKIHWLKTGENSSDLKLLFNSNLASTRLRIGVACQYLLKNNLYISYINNILSSE